MTCVYMFYFLRLPWLLQRFPPSFLFLSLLPPPFPPCSKLDLNSRSTACLLAGITDGLQMSGFFIFTFDCFRKISADPCNVFVSSKSPFLLFFWLQCFHWSHLSMFADPCLFFYILRMARHLWDIEGPVNFLVGSSLRESFYSSPQIT